MKRNYTFIPLLLSLIVAIVACSNNSSKSAGDNEETTTRSTVNVPQFNADSAYLYIQDQADFFILVFPIQPHIRLAENSWQTSWSN